MNSLVLVVPALEEGRGGGHICRCISLVNDLRTLGRKAMLYLPAKTETSKFVNLFKSMNFNQSWLIFNEEIEIRNKNLAEKFDFIILDRFQTPLDELTNWKKIAPVIGLDEGGKHRGRFDFLIDILIPEKTGKPRANIANPGLINFYRKGAEVAQRKEENTRVLISFGQEDPAGLGIKTAKKLSNIKNKMPLDITLLKGSLNTSDKTQNIPQSIKVLDIIPNLSQHLHEYDLVITHYGLTAYEALFSGTLVLLAHPTRLHKKLAKSAGFKTFSKDLTQRAQRRIGNAERLSDIFSSSQRPLLHCAPARKNLEYNSLVELINSFAPIVNRCCPVCGAVTGNNVSRFSDRTYRRCLKCGLIYMNRINPPPIEYEKEYFFENYVKQYGKTYLEDFENIKTSGKNRLKIIAKISRRARRDKKSSRRRNKAGSSSNLFPPCVPCSPAPQREEIGIPTLLDIGCAYGPFLAAAKEEGFSPFGIDPAQDAVKYINEKLGIPAIYGFFPSPLSPLPASYDIVTLWFVIEHFTDCAAVLTEVKKILKPGGILAFSTPSFSGISGRKALHKFLLNSPADHFTVWSPKSTKKALSLAGFKVKKIKVVGHHPQRFPLFGKLAKSKKSPFYWLLLAISKLFGLGDTFEVYAQNCKKP